MAVDGAFLGELRKYRLAHKGAISRKKTDHYEHYKVLCDPVIDALIHVAPWLSQAKVELVSVGHSNIMAARVETPERRYFVKITTRKPSREHVVYALLAASTIRQEGAHFSLHPPEFVIETAGLRAYFFENLDGGRLKDEQFATDRLDLCVNAIAELNALNRSPELARHLPVWEPRICLPRLDDFIAVFEGQEDLTGHHSRLTKIARKFNKHAGKETSGLTLCCGDFNVANFLVRDDRVIVLDMGLARMMPPGADLYWMLYSLWKTTGTPPQHAQAIFDRYAEAMCRNGARTDAQTALDNALSAYFSKWLSVNRSFKSTHNWSHFQLCMDWCEEFVG